MRDDLYATLQERIVKVVPEIMELKFGCKVKIVGGSSFSGRVFDCVDGDMTVQPHPYGEGSLRSNGDSCGSCDFDKGEYEILGRDIQLADVLRAIEETRKTDEDPILLHVTGEFDTYDRKDVLRLLKRVPWDTSLPLHEQSDELGEWLLTILTTSA